MTTQRAPLGFLDLVPVSAGSSPAQALRNSIDPARTAERYGCRRYWFAEHHLNLGVAGSSPALLIAMAAAATEYIRLGSGGVQSGHRTALSVVEDFGLLDAMHPGRIDLGVGRSGGRNFFRDRLAGARELAAGYALWVRSIRTGEGAMPFPAPDEASRHSWTEADDAPCVIGSTRSSLDHPKRWRVGLPSCRRPPKLTSSS